MPDLLYEKKQNYAIFTYNRPERLNALGGTLMEELHVALQDFIGDPDMRAAIVTGAGRAFSAGADLKAMAERNASGQRQIALGHRGLDHSFPWVDVPKPVIAAVNGLAVGGGMETAMSCDIRIASTDAYFGLFEVKRGIMAGYGIHHLMRLIPASHAYYTVFTADRISPQQALDWGFVTEVVEPDRLIPRAEEIAAMIAENAPLAEAGSKAIMRSWRTYGIDDSLQLNTWVSKVVIDSEDAKEGPLAFTEKRAPVWKGR
ncbi:MAG: enoyl-CoA hydratase/isomerase family protein [Dehalococcoidia bacterium]